MPDDYRTPNEIERDIEREREELAQTVGELQDRFTPEAIMRDVARGFSEHGGDISRSISRSVKENPLALTLTGVGLAWMIFGKSGKDGGDRSEADYPRPQERIAHRATPSRDGDFESYDADDDDDVDDAIIARRNRLARSAARQRVAARRGSFASSRRYAETSDWSYADVDNDYDYGDDDDGLMDRASDAAATAGDYVSSGAQGAADAARSAGDNVASGASSAARGVRSGAQSAASATGSAASAVAGGFRSAVDAVRSAAKSAADGVTDAAGSAADGVSNAANSASWRAARLRDQLAEGTENMSESARERVIHARARFIDARRRADAAARAKASKGADAVGGFIEEQPLVAGALAMAVGAALAGALPRTKREDDLFGAKSDELYDHAERVFYRERAKAEEVAKAAVNEAGDIVEEKRREADQSAPGAQSAVQKAADEVRDASARIKDAATSEAERQDLGKPEKPSS